MHMHKKQIKIISSNRHAALCLMHVMLMCISVTYCVKHFTTCSPVNCKTHQQVQLVEKIHEVWPTIPWITQPPTSQIQCAKPYFQKQKVKSSIYFYSNQPQSASHILKVLPAQVIIKVSHQST